MRKAAAGLALLWILIYVAPLGVLPMGTPDETRYAEIAREMLASGDYVVPRLNGVLYLEKPPLSYWAIGLSLAIFGENNFAARLPSALSVGLTALLVALLVRRLTRDPEESLLAAAVYGTSVMVFGLGSLAMPDSMLTLFLAGTVAAGLCALDATLWSRRAGWLALAGLFCGLALLTKGFLAVALPGMIIGSWLLFSPRRWQMVKMAWLPALVVMAVVAPWGILIHLRAPEFWPYFYWVQHVERFLAPNGASHHPEPVWFFMPILAYGILPWLVIVPVAAIGLRGLWRSKPWLAPIAAWFILPLLFFSASSGKLATYILPVYPPFAILMAAGLMEAARRGKGLRLFKIGGMILGGAALVTMPAVWLVARPYYSTGEGWKWIALLVALAFWAGASLLAMRSPSLRRGIRAYAAGPLVLFGAIHFLYPVTADARPSLSAFVEQHRADIPPTAMVVADTEVVHGLCWLLQRDDLLLFPVGGELSYGLSREGAEGRLLDPQRLAEWVQDPARREDLVLILDDKKFTGLLAEHLDPLALKPEIRRESLGFLLLRYAPSSGAGGHEADRTAGKE